MDEKGDELSEMLFVNWPDHFATDNEGHLIVADHHNHRVLLLDSQLRDISASVGDKTSQMKLSWPKRLCYNELTSQLYVLHNSSRSTGHWRADVLSQFSVR